MPLPEDVSIRISNHNGLRLRLMYQLWEDWLEAIGDPDKPDEMFNCLLEAADCFQGATFNFLHGFYRTALAELRTALELVMIGTYGTLYPNNKGYLQWKAVGHSARGRRLADLFLIEPHQAAAPRRPRTE
jgi:hypothetical protein